MLTHYYESPHIIGLLRNGPGGKHLDGFAQDLWDSGYAQLTARRHIRAAQHLIYWSRQQHLPLEDLGYVEVQSFGHHLPRCCCQSFGRSDRSLVKGAHLFVEYLCKAGLVAPLVAVIESAPPALLVAFQHWMRENRSVGDRALKNYSLAVNELLRALGEDPSLIDARSLREFVLEKSRQYGRSKAKTVVTALRMFVRFLIVEGQCSVGLDAAIPSLAQWRLSELPRYLQPEEVERVIAACKPATTLGIRDRAIVLLLARLALRASDIVHLQLGDIHWANATITVTGKGRQQTQLPLSQELGDALAAYLTDARPKVDTSIVFIRSRAPFKGFASHAAISMIVAKAMKRAGVVPTVRGAAHLLRHSAATSMLRQGASLYDVAAVLRHQSIETTTIYAKVDFGALELVLQPWPEMPSC